MGICAFAPLGLWQPKGCAGKRGCANCKIINVLARPVRKSLQVVGRVKKSALFPGKGKLLYLIRREDVCQHDITMLWHSGYNDMHQNHILGQCLKQSCEYVQVYYMLYIRYRGFSCASYESQLPSSSILMDAMSAGTCSTTPLQMLEVQTTRANS
jgi:hypothetical protein